jgi:hypothetical protein
MNSAMINNTTNNGMTPDGWQLWMNRKARRAAERGSRNRTLTRLIREEQAAERSAGRKAY